MIATKIYKAAYWAPRIVERSVQKWISSGLSWTFGQSNLESRHPLSLPLVQMQRLYTLTNEARDGRYYLLQGTELNSGLPLRAALVGQWETGQRNTLPFYQHMLFGDNSAALQRSEEFPLWQTRRWAEKAAAEADIVLVEANTLLQWHPSEGEWASGPANVRMVFDYYPGETWETVENRLKSQRANLKKIRRGGFTYRVSRSDEDFTTFYNHYYVPMVRQRFQDYGDIDNEPGLRKEFHKHGLLIIVQDAQGETVSMEFDFIRHKVLYALLAGVRDGDRDLVNQGALAASYYFSFHYGFETGCRRHDAGPCSPYSTDGVYRHKHSWGYRPILNDWRPRFQLFWAPGNHPGALAWMQANPFVQQYARWGGEAMREVYEAA